MSHFNHSTNVESFSFYFKTKKQVKVGGLFINSICHLRNNQNEVLGQRVSTVNAAKSPKHETSAEASQLLKTNLQTQSCPKHFKQLLFLGLN